MPRYSENYNPDRPETNNKKTASSITVTVWFNFRKIRKNIFPVKCGNPQYSENYYPDWPETEK